MASAKGRKGPKAHPRFTTGSVKPSGPKAPPMPSKGGKGK